MGSPYQVADPTSPIFGTDNDDPAKQFAKIMSPTSPEDLVGPPPDRAPESAPGQSTPRTGNLTAAPLHDTAKNLDTPQGQAAYNVPLASQFKQQQATYNASPTAAAVNAPGPRMPLNLGGAQTSPLLPPGATPLVAPDRLNMQTQQDQQRLSQLQQAPAGGAQVHNRFGRIAARIGDIAGSVLAPNVAQYISGTTLNKARNVGIQQGIVNSDQGQLKAAADLADTQGQQAEREALGRKADALAQSDQPMTPTPEQAAAVGHPEIANLPIPPRTYSAMLVAKQRADAQEQTGAGHDTAKITATGMNNTTSAANNAATNATRVSTNAATNAAHVATSKYGHGGSGNGAGSAVTPSGEPGDLSGIPENVRGLVQAIGEGREGPAPLGRNDGKEIMRLVSQAYPDYDASQFHNYQATRAEFAKGKTGQAINSFNTSLQHLGRMEDHLPANGSIHALNWLKNTALKETGSPANSAFEADRIAVAGEVGKAYKGGVLTKEENDQYQNLLDRDASPAQQRANIAELKGLLEGKLNSFEEQYKTGLPTGATRGFQIISPEAQKVLGRGKTSGGPSPDSHVFNSVTYAAKHTPAETAAAVAYAKKQGYTVK